VGTAAKRAGGTIPLGGRTLRVILFATTTPTNRRR
jgi:hypothetical protein